jgi:ribosomal protein S18 acetylase RimI-like enzyme
VVDAIVLTTEIPAIDECERLYRSVGWTAYLDDLDQLHRAMVQSTAVVVGRDRSGELCGLIRAISDDSTICYVQDLLVSPEWQGRGVGSELLRAIQSRFGHCRQFVLTTDSGSESGGFYRANGLVPHAEQGLVAYGRPQR